MAETKWTKREITLMREAYTQAGLGRGKTYPNPPVGAVIVKNNRIIARGFTSPPGGPHAEINALRQAGSGTAGAILFVTLEPCSHFGRTPPCTEAIIKSGISEVIISLVDPNKPVNGSGIKRLREGGLRVKCGLLREKGEIFYNNYMFYVRNGRPKIILKIAQSLDGSINARPGKPEKITGEMANRWAHGLRNSVDAVLVGGKTFRVDNPDLTPRLIKPEYRVIPQPIIISRSGKIPLTNKVMGKNRKIKPLIISSGLRHYPAWVETAELPSNGPVIPGIIRILKSKGYHGVLVEGGADIISKWLNSGLWDVFYILTGNKFFPKGQKWASGLSRNWQKTLKLGRFWHAGDDSIMEIFPD